MSMLTAPPRPAPEGTTTSRPRGGPGQRLADLVDVVVGVDTHKDTHTACFIATATGAVLAHLTVTADAAGYMQLCDFADTVAEQHALALRAWCLEGAGGYGAGLAAHLHVGGEVVAELDRPVRPARRGGRKDDDLDAERAAREGIARARLSEPKVGATRAALAMHHSARRGAVRAAADAQRQLLALVVTAPESVRARLRGRSTDIAVSTAAAWRVPTVSAAHPLDEVSAIEVLRDLARRVRYLHAEAKTHEKKITELVRSWRPDLLEVVGVGPTVAAVILVAWSHPGRCRSAAAFAMLAGVAPIPASSGKTVRYRFNPAGNRALNEAFHHIVMTRKRLDPVTQTYYERRRGQGKNDPEIRRCLKTYVARQIFRQLENGPADPLDET